MNDMSFISWEVIMPYKQSEKTEAKKDEKKNLIFANKLSATRGVESYLLRKSQAFFDLKTEKFTNFNFSLRLQNAYTDTFLLSTRDSLGTLKGSLSGDVEASLFDDKAVFTIKDKVQIKNFRYKCSRL